MDLQTRIAALVEQPLFAMGYLLVRVRFGGGNRPVLQIMAERPDGTMTVEDCAEVSRAISAILDVEDPIDGRYALEISSPGIDRPLVKLDDYRRFAGYEARIETVMPIDGRKRWRGRIIGADAAAETVTLATDDAGEVTLPFDRIAEARLLLTDELISASLKGVLPPPAPVAGLVPPPPRPVSDDVEIEEEDDEEEDWADEDPSDPSAPEADASR